ncbi:MAG: citrate synthase [Verrucomicrobiota bacterium]
MEDKATLSIGDKSYDCPVITGTEDEKAFDIRKIRAESGFISFDEGYGNTGSCQSEITYIDGEKGILRYRGYPIEELAAGSSFLESTYLIIYGELPSEGELEKFRQKVRSNAAIHTGMKDHFDGFPLNANPMAVLSAMLNSLGCYYPEMATNNRQQDLDQFDEAAAVLISKVRTIAALSYRMRMGKPFVYPKKNVRYCDNFLHMMFSDPYDEFEDTAGLSEALDLFLLLHADHEQNCSTSTVRMVASGGANLFASVSAGVCALWGPSHGGANQAVISMLEQIHESGDDGMKFIEAAKSGKAKLMGFGHRVYKNYDPRAKILGEAAERVLSAVGVEEDPLLKIARNLERTALEDEYFVERKLYPNVDFYSGLILKAAGIPVEFFTVMFAIGRMPGWLANWREIASDPKSRIHRPRQIYQGPALRSYVPVVKRS